MKAKTRRILTVTIAFGTLVFVVLFTYLILNTVVKTNKISTKQDANTVKADKQDKVLEAVKALAQDIRSCTTPGLACSERSRKATAKAVGDIGKMNAASSAASTSCAVQLQKAKKPVTFPNVYRCTVATLKAQQDRQ